MPNAGDDDASLQGATGPVRESMQLTDSVVFNCAWQASWAEQESQTSQSPEPTPQKASMPVPPPPNLCAHQGKQLEKNIVLVWRKGDKKTEVEGAFPTVSRVYVH